MIEIKRGSDKKKISDILSKPSTYSAKHYGTRFKITKVNGDIFLKKKDGNDISAIDKLASPHYMNIHNWFALADLQQFPDGEYNMVYRVDGSVVQEIDLPIHLSPDEINILSNGWHKKWIDTLDLDSDVSCVIIRSELGAVRISNYKYKSQTKSQMTDSYKRLYADILDKVTVDRISKVMVTSMEHDHLYFILINRMLECYMLTNPVVNIDELRLPESIFNEVHKSEIINVLGDSYNCITDDTRYAIFVTILLLLKNKVMKNNDYLNEKAVDNHRTIVDYMNKFLDNPLLNSSTPSYTEFWNK